MKRAYRARISTVLVTIPDLLSAAELAEVHALLDQGEFIDGRLSAGTEARRVKHNEELRQAPDLYQRLNRIVMNRLVRHPLYRLACLPLRVAAPFYARYRPGMTYGYHVDDPVMGGEERYRSDVSTTVFLTDPSDYEGGELSVRTTFGLQRIKLPAGQAVVYPSSSLHRVEPVRSGERRVAVTWAQSMVRDPGQRALLFELGQIRERLLAEQPELEETGRLSNVYANLVRMWADI